MLGPVLLHQMYAYERFKGILKSFAGNQAYPEGSMVQGYCTEEAVEWALNHADPSNPISVPKSCHEGRLTRKGTIGKNARTLDPHLFRCAHFHVLQHMSIVSEYFDEHVEVLLRDNPDCNESWLASEHTRKFIGWLRDQISHSSDTQTSEYLKKLARGLIFTVMTYQGYAINGYTFYTEQLEKTHIRIVVYVLMLRAKTKACTMVKYKRSWSLTFTISRFLPSVATGLMQSRVLYKTSTGSLAVTLTVRDISQSLLC
jgi:hypothetical protein